MIARMIEFSIKNKFLIFLLTIFLISWGIWAIKKTPLDAIPDLSDVQVIVFTEWPGRSPDLVEDQITYPIVTTMLSAPKVQTVRGFSFFGYSFIYIIFEDGTDIYWARSRVLEYLQQVLGKLPPGVTPKLGPDATGVGWGFSYAVVDESGKHDLQELRSIQDWFLKYAIESVPGVAEVASLGGFVKQYQVNIDPVKLLSYRIPINRVIEAVSRSNRDVEGRLLEFSGREYMVRGRGYIKNVTDLENVVVAKNEHGTPVFLKDIATVQLGPEIRRGIADLDGKGEVVAGIVVIRFGENVLNVINRVKEKIKEIEPSLPKGVKIVVTYDRSDLIYRSIETLRDEIIKLSVAVGIVCIVFLYHLPSAFVIILTLPVAIIISFICMYYLKITSNIMSLGGIAIAIGAMVDASIIMVENAHKKLEKWEEEGRQGSRIDVIIDAAKEVGPSLFFALLVITVGFLPIFALEAQEGRLFKPLAYTKTFSMFFASFLAITLTPVLMTIFIRGKIRPEEKNPVSRFLMRIYQPVCLLVLKFRWAVIIGAFALILLTIPAFLMLGSEFMPPLYEGTLLYMPVTVPSISITQAGQLLQIQDKILKSFPEVEQVFGKAGRAESATDPAPLEMMETVINLKDESKWRPGMTPEKLVGELDNVMRFPGVSNAWTMPVKARIDMLTTGIRTPVGIKIFGRDLSVIEKIGLDIEKALMDVKGTRNIYAERVTGGYFYDLVIKRDEIARYGLTVEDVNEVIQTALGGMRLTTTVEGRERYPVNVRYMRELRDEPEMIKRILVGTSDGAQIPLDQLVEMDVVKGPPSIKSEEGMLVAYVYVDVGGRDIGGYVSEAKRVVSEKVKIPSGYFIEWSGQYEFMQRVKEKLKYVIPLTAMIIFVLIYINTKSIIETVIVLLAVPFSLVGAFWLLYILGYNMSIAVWVGIIALAGLDAETGVVMLLYLDLAYKEWKSKGMMRNLVDLEDAVIHGAVKRIRPKIMTVSVIPAGLIPIMFSHGTGADVMKRIAAPMIGGVITSAILELLIYPAIYTVWKWRWEVMPSMQVASE